MRADKRGLVELDKSISRTGQNWIDNRLSGLDRVDQLSGQVSEQAGKQIKMLDRIEQTIR